MNTRETPLFEAADHYYLPAHGGFVIGHIRGSVSKIGMRIRRGSDLATLTVCGIESLDNVRERVFRNALVSLERQALTSSSASSPWEGCLRVRAVDPSACSSIYQVGWRVVCLRCPSEGGLDRGS
jgi:hypothetical protein